MDALFKSVAVMALSVNVARRLARVQNLRFANARTPMPGNNTSFLL